MENLDRQVRYFIKIAELKSLSRVADSLDLTQSGLSRQLAALEGLRDRRRTCADRSRQRPCKHREHVLDRPVPGGHGAGLRHLGDVDAFGRGLKRAIIF